MDHGETHQVSLMNAKDDQEINPKDLLTVDRRYVIPKQIFKELYLPLYNVADQQKDQIDMLVSGLKV